MVDVERIRRLHDALTRECERYTLEEAMNALAACSAAALSVAPKANRDNIFQVFCGAIVNSLKAIDARADPLLTGKVIQ